MIGINELPDVLNGVSSQAEWEARRTEIKVLLSREEYGFFPEKLPVTVKTVTEDKKAFAGKAVDALLEVTMEKDGKRFSFPATLVYPKGEKKVPFFVFANFELGVPNKRYPAEEIVDHGFGVISFCHNDVSLDKNEFGDGFEKLFLEGERENTCFGKITLWAYAMQRLLDYILSLGIVDEKKIAAIGHSRLGKTALWAGANDERFTYVISNDSGCSGAAIARQTTGETVKNITDQFPYWFCPNYFRYAQNEDEMPFDQHFLLALCAPRTVIVGAAKEDAWADSYNQYLAAKATLPVYELFDKGGGFDDETPQTWTKYGGDGVYYREREGTHFLSRTDWNYYMEIIERD